MSKDFKFELNSAGVRELLQGAEMQNVLIEKASGIRSRAGEGYSQDIYVGKTRANSMVWPDNFEAKRNNMKNNTLLKALK